MFVAPLSVHSIMISCRALHIAVHMSVRLSMREREREGADKGFRELPIRIATEACHFYGDANAASAAATNGTSLYHTKSLRAIAFGRNCDHFCEYRRGNA